MLDTQRRGQSTGPPAPTYPLALPAQVVYEALNSLATTTGHSLLVSSTLAENLTSSAVHGTYTVEGALQILLQGTGLSGRLTDHGVIVVRYPRVSINTINGEETMNSKKQLLAATVGFLMGAGGASQSVMAQESSEDNQGWVLEEIVVTAQKREQNLMDVPISVVALTGEAIEARGIQNGEDLTYFVPNLSAFSPGPGVTSYYMRGIGSSNIPFATVGTYFDEVPISVAINEPDIRTTDLERVEVLRGPQGTLFGQGSVGGTIRFITKNPEFNSVGGHLGVSAYHTKEGGTSEELTGVLNIPVVDDTLAFRIASTYENKAGWIDKIDRDGAVIKEDINDNEGSNIRIKGLWQATDNLAITAMVVRHRLNAGGPNIVSSGGRAPQPESLIRSAADPYLPFGFTDEHDIYNVTATYDFGNAVLTAVASSVETSNLRANFPVFLTVDQGLPVADENVVEFNTIDFLQETEVTSQEIRLSSAADSDSAWEWIVGVFLAESELSQEDAGGLAFDAAGVFFPDNPGELIATPATPPTVNKSDSGAFFGNISYAFTDQWTIGIGTRVFKDDRSIFTAADGLTLDDDFDNVSSKIHLSYAATDNANIYFSASEGFRSGGLNPPVTR
ncbi:TonB-dependent receptor domain-containing protein [Oceanicoccus sagamiensis]|uniref:Secretin/TonB short N-terminal domain-containing protein n=1 Tax=Oceanicoccus sagamiensis TaxID=716816 RepID=A0A1X9NII4_9GAMM|nr:TonB-dependent receptor [Oceanicoccus sagamiensis]ARN73793.1 hypothetical protein BST96_06500 [Oceanicoccus sagamiensis]